MSDYEDNIENVIIKLMYTNKDVREKVLPYIRFSLFELVENIELVKFIKKFIERYDKFPSVKETRLKIKKPELYEHLKGCVGIDTSEYTDEIILDEIQDYIKEKCVMDVCVGIVEKINNGEIDDIKASPDDMREAMAFSFDDKVGLDIFDETDEDSIYDFFHNKEYVIPTGLTDFDKLIDGGFHEKSLSLFMAETNMGKSLIMTALASNNILQNKNVLYVTYEMSEFKIGERILANIFDVDIGNIKKMSKDSFSKHFKKARDKIKSKFVVKEYSTKGGTVNHIRNLIKELYLKKKFKPDIIYIDYIGIMASTFTSKSDNSYSEIKRITEEVRGLSVELGLPIVSAIQTNRNGMGKDELELSNASDSVGTVFTADLVVSVTQSDTLREAGRYLWTLIKNRYGENKRSIPIEVNYPKMRLSDVDDDRQNKEPKEDKRRTKREPESDSFGDVMPSSKGTKRKKQSSVSYD